MPNQPYSSVVVAGTDAVAADHNAARKDALTRYLKFEVIGTLVVGDKQGGSFNAPFNCTLVNTNVRTTSGGATVRVNRDATVMDSGLSATSSPSDNTSPSSPLITKGQLITMDVTAISSGIGLVVTLEVLITT